MRHQGEIWLATKKGAVATKVIEAGVIFMKRQVLNVVELQQHKKCSINGVDLTTVENIQIIDS